MSAFLDRRPEDVRVQAVIIAELELGHIEREVLFADLVESPDHAPLDQRPEAFTRVRVNGADDVLPFGVVDRGVREHAIQPLITNPLIRAEQADLGRNGFVDEAGKSGRLRVRDDASDNASLAPDCASDNAFADSRTAGADAVVTIALMPVLGLSADEGFVNFKDPGELFKIAISERGADAMAHMPRGLIGTEANEAIDLQSAHSLLARQHQVNNAKPILQRLVRIFEDRTGDMREAIACLRRASVALPMPRVAFAFARIFSTTTRAADAIGPTASDQVSRASVFVREHFIELRGGQLVNGFGLFFAGHSVNSPSMGAI